MGWTRDQLDAQDEEFVWALVKVLDLEGQKSSEDLRKAQRGTPNRR